MTEQIKSAIDVFENAKKGIVRYDMTEWYDLAICSLQAWSEVLQELEEVKEDIKESNFGYCIGKLNGLNKAIDLINQHLSKIEKVR